MTDSHGPRDLDDPDVDGFLLVAERGSITLAARELCLSQSGLSRQLLKLEQRLGTPLLQRVRGGVHLTPAGERYRAYARDVRVRRRQLLQELWTASETPLSGDLRIAASTTPSEFVVPRLLGDFTSRYPEVRPIVITANSRTVLEELRARQWDVGFVGACIPTRGVRFIPVATDEIVLAVPAGHRLAGQREVSIEALVGQDFIEREEGSGTGLSVRRTLATHGLEIPPHRVRMTLGSTSAILAAVRAGYGIGLVSALALSGRRERRVVPVRLAGLPLRRQLYLVRRTAVDLAPAARAFLAFVVATRR